MKTKNCFCMLMMTAALSCCMASWACAGHRAESMTLSPMLGGYVFDSELDLDDSMAPGLFGGYNFTEHISLEGAFFYSQTELDGTSRDVDTTLYMLNGLYHFMPKNKLVPYLSLGAGMVGFDPDNADDENEFSASIGAGIKYFIAEDVALRADVRDIATFPENSLLYSAGITFYLGGKSHMATAEIIADSDGDGVYDDKDQCPGTPAGAPVDAAGCPLDSDGDGVSDYKDQCPRTPEGIAVDTVGCPLDSDGDGVWDTNDQCPGTPRGTEVDKDGCALPLDDLSADSDGDGVTDIDDQCPGTPQGADVDTRGCWVIRNLNFDVSRDEIKPAYYAILDNIVDILNMNSGLRVEIQGHTDGRGSRVFNEGLSQRRAQAVKMYLIDHGIDGDRLTARGYGPANPIADESTPEGRAQNRRVEIKPLY